MEHVNAATSLHQQQQQQQQQLHHHQNLQQQHNQQQQQSQQQPPPPPANSNDNQQQFCLRWHNHQTSLLSTLPILLDQSHLTDVTLSAEGRILRAHRVVLSACSTFFLELFRALDTSNHPVIIIPGASFAAIVALLTFMYSGEVNVYEEQIPTLLNLAETLGIKGLADVQNNLQKSAKRHSDYADQLRKAEVETPPTPSSPADFAQPPAHGSGLLPPPLAAMPSLATPTPAPSTGKLTTASQTQSQTPMSTPLPMSLSMPLALPTPLESLFLKSLQFYPNLLPQPLNFSQSALNKTSELLAKYQQHCSLYQSALGGVSAKDLLGPLYMEEAVAAAAATATAGSPGGGSEDGYGVKRLCTGDKKPQQQQQQQHQHQQQQQKDIKRIDKIVESLRCGNNNKAQAQGGDGLLAAAASQQQQLQQQQQQHFQKQQQQLQLSLKTSVASFAQSISPHLTTKPPMFASASSQHQQQQQQLPGSSAQHGGFMSPEEQAKLQQQLEHFASCSRGEAAASNRATPDCVGLKPDPGLLSMAEKMPPASSASAHTTTPASPQAKAPSNSKLYATCFICHKQLSNQYNLRVHLETHQNVRYACNVCSHVSRSKDALRKHVSYRHPGAPSPCESEARRKRAKTLNLPSSSPAATSVAGTPPSPTSAPTTPFQLSAGGGGEAGDVAGLAPGYLFLPNQFHMAAAAAANNAHQQQQQQLQQHQQQQQNSKGSSNTNSSLPTTPTAGANNSNSNSNVISPSPSTSAPAAPTAAAEANDMGGGGGGFVAIKSEHSSPAESEGGPLVGGAVTTP